MGQGRVVALLAAFASLLAVAGCGSSDSSGVTVESGSLSKAAFVKKADAICTASHGKLVTQFYSFISSHQADANGANPQKREALLNQAIGTVVAPNVEDEIKKISALGAPDEYTSEVAIFLTALQDRLDEMQAKPAELMTTATPFKQAGEAAQEAGLNGCAATLS